MRMMVSAELRHIPYGAPTTWSKEAKNCLLGDMKYDTVSHELSKDEDQKSI